MLEVISDRTVNGVQEFLCNWEGSSPHQWVQGKALDCNAALEEYAIKTGNALDWRFLSGQPNPLLHTEAKGKAKAKLLTYSKGKHRAKLDWEGKPKTPKRKSQITTKGTADQVGLKRPSRPRMCKFN